MDVDERGLVRFLIDAGVRGALCTHKGSSQISFPRFSSVTLLPFHMGFGFV